MRSLRYDVGQGRSGTNKRGTKMKEFKLKEMQKAIERVEQAGINAPRETIIQWIKSLSSGPKVVLESTLTEIREVANGF